MARGSYTRRVTVALTARQRRFVDELVKSGRYADEDTALRAGLHLLEELEQQREEERAKLRALIDPAIAEFERGEYYTLDEAYAHAVEAIREVEREIASQTGPAKRRRAG